MSQLDEVVKKYQLKIFWELIQAAPNLNSIINYMDAIKIINNEFRENYRSDFGGYIKSIKSSEFLSEFPLKD